MLIVRLFSPVLTIYTHIGISGISKKCFIVIEYFDTSDFMLTSRGFFYSHIYRLFRSNTVYFSHTNGFVESNIFIVLSHCGAYGRFYSD